MKKVRVKYQRRHNQTNIPNTSSHPDTSDINLFDIFDTMQAK